MPNLKEQVEEKLGRELTQEDWEDLYYYTVLKIDHLKSLYPNRTLLDEEWYFVEIAVEQYRIIGMQKLTMQVCKG